MVNKNWIGYFDFGIYPLYWEFSKEGIFMFYLGYVNGTFTEHVYKSRYSGIFRSEF